jgi:hypothetical protein
MLNTAKKLVVAIDVDEGPFGQVFASGEFFAWSSFLLLLLFNPALDIAAVGCVGCIVLFLFFSSSV